MYAVYYQKPHLTIYYDEARSLGKSEWNGFVSGEEYRESSLACLKLMKEKQVRFWVADDRNMRAIRLKDQEWTNTVLIPKILLTNLEKMALIVSNDMFNQIAVDSMIDKASDNLTFEIKYFNDLAAGEEWVNQYVVQEKDGIQKKK
ncbi:hypothetical protein BH24BAC1_BH24BAC1_25280 [soil metagenome]|jgi:hypothetical protein